MTSGTLGNHRLLCGDATVLADVEHVLGGQLADMTWTDPPYNVDYANSPKDKLRGKHRPILNDSLGSGAARGHDIAVLSELLPAAEAGVLEALWDTGGGPASAVEDLGRKKHGSMERSLK